MRTLHKLIVIGDGGVGKTTTIHNVYKYLAKKFPESSFTTCDKDDTVKAKAINRTKFIDFHTISFVHQDHKIVWQIWDLQGQRFPSNKAYTSLNPLDHITGTVVKNADLILLVYDCSCNSTFNELFREKGFYDLISPFITQDQSFLLLANKTDLLDKAKDSVSKVATDRITHKIPDPILFNNTFLENISVLSEAMLSILHLTADNMDTEPTQQQQGREAVSLKVYR